MLLPVALATLITTESYDYVIAGAGTSGLVLANKLSADANVHVLVIEPGGDERANANVSSLPGWGNNKNSHVNWRYESVPQTTLNNSVVLKMAAGKGIGGTSLMNGK